MKHIVCSKNRETNTEQHFSELLAFWTLTIVRCFLASRIPDDGQCPKTQQFWVNIYRRQNPLESTFLRFAGKPPIRMFGLQRIAHKTSYQTSVTPPLLTTSLPISFPLSYSLLLPFNVCSFYSLCIPLQSVKAEMRIYDNYQDEHKI
jgi:hypothetical protein